MEYLKRDDMIWKISQSIGLKDKLLRTGKQTKIIPEKRKNSNSINLEEKEFKDEIKDH